MDVENNGPVLQNIKAYDNCNNTNRTSSLSKLYTAGK